MKISQNRMALSILTSLFLLTAGFVSAESTLTYSVDSGTYSWWAPVWYNPFETDSGHTTITMTITGDVYAAPGANTFYYRNDSSLTFVSNTSDHGDGYHASEADVGTDTGSARLTNNVPYVIAPDASGTIPFKLYVSLWAGVNQYSDWSDSENSSNSRNMTGWLDITPPTCSLPDTTTAAWTGSPITVSFTMVDSGSGVASVQYFDPKSNKWSTLNPSGGSYSFTISKSGNYSIQAADNLGNTKQISYIVTPPGPPQINDASSLQLNVTNSSPLVWNASITSAFTIATVTAQLEFSPDNKNNFAVVSDPVNIVAPSGSGPSYGFSVSPKEGDGYYLLSITATDSAEGSTTSTVSTFELDTTPPSNPVALSTNFVSSGSGQFSSLVLQWSPVTDNLSGVKGYQIYYDTDGSKSYNNQWTPTNPAGTSIPIDKFRGDLVDFKVAAIDNAGNQSYSTISQPVPTVLSPSISLISNQDIGVAIALNVTPTQFLTFYSKVRVTRSAGLIKLPDLVIDSTTQANWSSDPTTGNLIYHDLISPSTGAGNKTLTEAVYETPVGASSEEYCSSANVVLPYHTGSVDSTLRLTDLAGNPVASGAQVNSQGKFLIQFQGSDPDQDPWSFEIDQVQKSGSGTGVVGYSSLSGSPVPYIYSATLGAYPIMTIPITLTAGQTNLCVTWTVPGVAATFHSEVLTISLVDAGNGSFTVNITSGSLSSLTSSGSTVTTRPGVLMTFSVPNPSDGVQYYWTFGDGNSSSGASVQYAYSQAQNQSIDHAVHPLSMTGSDGTAFSLSVLVQDTQSGSLATNEIWHGAHTVTGVVDVPAGLTLTIGSDVALQFLGSLAQGFGQGLTVQGSLVIDDGATLGQAASQTSGWGTIFITGNATIGAATISNADRGVAVSGGTVTLTGTTLQNNVIGLHVVGAGSNVMVQKNSIITGNQVYGIKEDSGGRPILTGSTILGNGTQQPGINHDYYSWDGDLLSIQEINALTGNSGNTGE